METWRVMITHVLNFERMEKEYQEHLKEEGPFKFSWEEVVKQELRDTFIHIYRHIDDGNRDIRFEKIPKEKSVKLKEIMNELLSEMKMPNKYWICNKDDEAEFERAEALLKEKFEMALGEA